MSFKCCDGYTTYVNSEGQSRIDHNYNTGFVCDYCKRDFEEPWIYFSHCNSCGTDMCGYCVVKHGVKDSDVDCESDYEMKNASSDDDISEDTLTESSDSESDDDDEIAEGDESKMLRIGHIAKTKFNMHFSMEQLQDIGKIAKDMYFYKNGEFPKKRKVNGGYAINEYQEYDHDVVYAAIKCYREKWKR